MLVWILQSFLSQIITFCLLTHSSILVESSATAKVKRRPFTVARGLLSLSECQHLIFTQHSKELARTGLVHTLNKALLPIEVYFDEIPAGNPQIHARRYRSHCLVRSLLIPAIIKTYDIASAMRQITGDFTWDKEKDVILIIQQSSFHLNAPEDQHEHMRFCELPLNYFLIVYNEKSNIITSQRAVKQCCKGGKRVCFFKWKILHSKRNTKPFKEIAADWKKIRRDFHGCRVTYEEVASAVSWQQMHLMRKEPVHTQ